MWLNKLLNNDLLYLSPLMIETNTRSCMYTCMYVCMCTRPISALFHPMDVFGYLNHMFMCVHSSAKQARVPCVWKYRGSN